MIVPWLLAYSTEVRAVYSVLRRAVNEGIGADTIYRYLKQSGSEVVRSEIREVMGRLEIDKAWKTYIDDLSDAAKPLKSFLPSSATTMTKNYRYTLRVAGLNVKTGERATRVLSLTSNTLLSKVDAIELMTDALAERNGEPYLEVEAADVTWIERRA